MKAIILAAGKGRRLRPLTHTGPKHLLPIAGKPVILYGIEKLKELGLKEIGIVIGYKKELIKGYLKDGKGFGVKIKYIVQEPQLGIAHAIKTAEKYIGNDEFIVYLGDNLIKSSLLPFYEEFINNREISALILLAKVREPQRFGVAVLEGNKVIKLVEKPKEKISDLALVGIYFLRKEIFEAINNIKPSWRGEYEITDALQWLIDHGYRVEARLIKGWWADTGTDIDLIEANYLILSELGESFNKGTIKNSKIIGKVKIEENTVIENSVIRGPCFIGKGCRIKDAIVGPFVSIGNNCKIERAEINNSIILDECKISCRKRIVDSIIGSYSIVKENKREVCRFVTGDFSQIEVGL